MPTRERQEIQRRELPPREQLMRTAPFSVRAADAEDENDGLTLDGYAAVFNRLTIIDSWEGRFKEGVAPGSMKKSFRETTPRVQFDHGRHPLIGSIPIGAVRSVAEETDPVLAPDGGAHVIARLHDNWLIEPVRDAIASESIDGMSFRFTVVRDEWHDADGKKITDEGVLRELLYRSWYEDLEDDELLVRTLKEVKVPELGPVVWPAYAETSVSVRSKITIDLGRLHDPAQRAQLARAVILADQAEAETSTTAEGSPRPTAKPAAGSHEAEATDTPRSTDAPSAGEHESSAPPPRGQRPIDLWVRKARDTVLTIERRA